MRRTRRFAVLVAMSAWLAGACSDNERTPPPIPPERFTAGMTGYDPESWGVALRWEPVGWRDGLLLDVRVEDGPWAEVGTLGRDAQGAIVTFPRDLPDATRLTFRLRSRLGSEVSAGAAEVSMSYAVRPAWPPRVAAEGAGLVVSWVRRALVADAVRLERAFVSFGGTTTVLPAVELPATAVSYVDTDVGAWVDGGTISYRVVYVRRGVESERAVGRSPAAPPSAPVNVVATGDGKAVRVGWTNTSASATGIEIRRSSFPGGVSYPVHPHTTLPPDAVQFEETFEGHRIVKYIVTAVSAAGRTDATAASVATAPPELLQAFDVRIVELPDAHQAAGRPDTGFVLARTGYPSERCYLPVSGGWEEQPIATLDLPRFAVAFDGAAGLCAHGRTATTLSLMAHAPDGWSDVSVPTTGAASDYGADAAGGDVGIAWRDETGAHYASGSSGWSAGPAGCAGASLDPTSLRLDDRGEPFFVSGGGYEVGILSRRAAGTWSCEPIPKVDPAEPFYYRYDDVHAFAPTPGGGALVVVSRRALRDTLYAIERDASGWLPAQVIASGDFYGGPAATVTVAGDGRALVVLNGYPQEKSLLLREAGATTWTRLPLLPWGRASAGFDANGKVWILEGLEEDSGYGSEPVVRRPYALFVEK